MKTYRFNIEIELTAKSRLYAWLRVYRFIDRIRFLDNIDFKEIPEGKTKESIA